MSNTDFLLKELYAYFANTSREQVLKDWEASKKYDVGISVKEYLDIVDKNKDMNHEK